MSKTRKAYRKYFDDDFEYNDYDDIKSDRKLRERRKQRKLKNALKTKDIEVFYNDDYDYE